MIQLRPIKVLVNSSSSHDNGNKIDSSKFVQKPYLRTNYIESNIEEDTHLKNKNRIKNLPDPITIRKTASKNYVDNKFIDVEEHLTPKYFVDNTIFYSVEERSLLRLVADEKLKLDGQDSPILNSTLTTPKSTIEFPTKQC